MELIIDGLSIFAKPGQNLRSLIEELGLNTNDFASNPIAAKIAGEVFNLNYIPVRNEALNHDRASIRRAMAASGGIVSLLSFNDPTGKDVYYRTAQFCIFAALHRLWPQARVKMNCTLGNALYIEVRFLKTGQGRRGCAPAADYQ